MSDLSALLAEMRQLAADAAEIGEFRDADGTPNYNAINRFMRRQIVIHGGTEPNAGIAVFPLSYCALHMLTPEERERAYDLSWPVDAQREWYAKLQDDFERRFPDAARRAPADAVPAPDNVVPRDAIDALGLEPAPGILSRVFARRRLRR